MNLHFQVPFFCWPKFFLPTQSNRSFWFAAKLCVLWFMARKGFQQNWKISMCTKCWQLCSDEPLSFAMHIRSSWHFSIWLRSPFYFNFIIVYISYVFFSIYFCGFLHTVFQITFQFADRIRSFFIFRVLYFFERFRQTWLFKRPELWTVFLLRKLHS